MFDRTIFHIDVNSAYLSWEAVYRMRHKGGQLDLREIPSAVGGDIAMRRGIILAKSIPAKKYGIKTGESIPEARRKCRELVLVPPNYDLYEKASGALMKLLREYSGEVEQYSIDEAFVDMTAVINLYGGALAAAETMRNRIREELGFTVNVGVSDNKLLAKMASDFKKPDRVHTLYQREIKEKMWPLPVSDLFFVGRASAKKLITLGISTIGELAQADPHLLKVHLKKQGETIWAFANGIDLSPVQAVAPANKGYGNSTTIPFDVTDKETAHLVLLGLAETVGARLRQDEVKAGVIAVGIKDNAFSYSSHQRVLEQATDITKELYGHACGLFGELWNGSPIRHLGIHTGRIRDKGEMRQLDLFDTEDYEKLHRADLMADSIRRRYGIDAVKRAVFQTEDKRRASIDHMSGGISREKRTVDYDSITIL